MSEWETEFVAYEPEVCGLMEIHEDLNKRGKNGWEPWAFMIIEYGCPTVWLKRKKVNIPPDCEHL